MHSYGWTLEYTLNLPRRVLYRLHFAIRRREYEAYRNQAALQGVKLEPFDTLTKKSEELPDLNPEQETMINKAVDEILAEKAGA